MGDGVFEVPVASWLVPFLLLGLEERGHDGQELAQRLEWFGLEASPETMRRTLERMEDDGLVSREEDGTAGRSSRTRYEITASGDDYLGSWADALTGFREEVDLFFRAYRGGAQGMRELATKVQGTNGKGVE